MSYLQIKGLTKRYGAQLALNGVTLDLEQGSRLSIVGPSGSGKTTLLRLIAGFDVADEGSVTLQGKKMADNANFVPAHMRGIGVIAQDGALFPHLSVGENIGFGLPRRDPSRLSTIEALAETVGLSREMLRRRPDQISGGQQQRVAIARALARQPKLMLLDEPFSALDMGLRAATRQAVVDILAAVGVPSILVTHDQAEALSFADTVAILSSGRLVQSGSPEELYHRPRNRMVAEFLGDAIVVPANFEKDVANCLFGRLATSQHRRVDEHKVMIRPGQVAVTTSPGPEFEGCAAIVRKVDFAGAQCGIMLELEARDGGEPTKAPLIVLSMPPHRLPAVGDRVGLSVTGPVHPIA